MTYNLVASGADRAVLARLLNDNAIDPSEYPDLIRRLIAVIDAMNDTRRADERVNQVLWQRAYDALRAGHTDRI